MPFSRSGRATFSTQVSSGTSWPNWNTNPKSERRSALRWASDIADSSRPLYVIVPESGGTMPARQCSSVDLPDPEGPITATTSPGWMENSAPSRARVGP
ncbi:hypothetical protein RKD48_003032 [Streptomyces ambofaciens]